ncbi:MAG TPA: hypothetical protein VF380_03120, partial [Solirubrobacteraceae bacterium]
ELREPTARELGDAGDRLAHVCSRILAVAVAELEDPAGAPATAEGLEPLEEAAGAAPEGGGSRRGTGAVIVDELAGAAAPVGGAPASEPPDEPASEIEIRDERGWEGPAAWIGSIGRQLERYAGDGLAFSVLLVELGGFERQHAERATDAERLGEDVERLLTGELRALGVEREGPGGPSTGALTAAGSFTRERPGRYWLLAPRTDRHGAQRLAEALTRAIAAASSACRMGLDVAIGTASCPADGREAAALAAHADVALYAARAAARGPAAGARERF